MLSASNLGGGSSGVMRPNFIRQSQSRSLLCRGQGLTVSESALTRWRCGSLRKRGSGLMGEPDYLKFCELVRGGER